MSSDERDILFKASSIVDKVHNNHYFRLNVASVSYMNDIGFSIDGTQCKSKKQIECRSKQQVKCKSKNKWSASPNSKWSASPKSKWSASPKSKWSASQKSKQSCICFTLDTSPSQCNGFLSGIFLTPNQVHVWLNHVWHL